jgi:nicotinate-nucleotide pyrophosphorylase (carboxylating)
MLMADARPPGPTMPHKPGKRERENLWRLLEMARAEDLGAGGDVTSSLVPPEAAAHARFIARQPMVLCGVDLLETVAVAYDGQIRTTVASADGARLKRGDLIAAWEGPARGIMSAERVALNFLQRLSGVATATAEYVAAVAGTAAGIYDTRKTTPGWRELEKYAVRVGGGKNHRRGLYDAVLVKDNHLAVLARAEGRDPLSALAAELERVRPHLGDRAFIELEVDTLEQFAAALGLPVDIILLDNMSLHQLRTAVDMRDKAGLRGRLELEASGGITLLNVAEVARTGVDRISVGALTHSAGAVDIGLDIELD